jgi:pilus assembly protein Flp/PilA
MREIKMKTLINFLKDENGATAVEYGLLVTLIAIVVIVGITQVGTKLNTNFTTIAGKL